MQGVETPVYLCVDTETTGVDVFNDRIVQLFVATADGDGNLLDTWEWFINPGVPVPKGASDVHGFTNEFLAGHGEAPESALARAVEVFRDHTDMIWVAFNMNFDLSILDAEFKRYGITHNFAEAAANQVALFDPMVVDRAKDKYRKGKRTLEALAGHYGVPFNPEEAHSAVYDVEATARVAVKVARKYGIPATYEQSRMHQSWAAGITTYFAKQGKLEEDGSPIVVSGDWPYRKES